MCLAKVGCTYRDLREEQIIQETIVVIVKSQTRVINSYNFSIIAWQM